MDMLKVLQKALKMAVLKEMLKVPWTETLKALMTVVLKEMLKVP